MDEFYKARHELQKQGLWGYEFQNIVERMAQQYNLVRAEREDALVALSEQKEVVQEWEDYFVRSVRTGREKPTPREIGDYDIKLPTGSVRVDSGRIVSIVEINYQTPHKYHGIDHL